MASVASIVQAEAGSVYGQAAVLNVMNNRAAQNFGGYGTTLFAQANAPGQFEGRIPESAVTSDTNTTVSMFNSGDIGDTTSGALYFVSPRSGSSWGGVAGATGPATAGILGGGNNIGGNYFSDRWGAPSPSFNAAFKSDTQAPGGQTLAPDGTPLAGGVGPVVGAPDGNSLTVATPEQAAQLGPQAAPQQAAQLGQQAAPQQAAPVGSTTIPQAIDNQSKVMTADTSAATKAASGISDAVIKATDAIAATASATEKNIFSRGVMILVGVVFVVGGLYMFGRATVANGFKGVTA